MSRLTKEVVELRLYKASLCSPEDMSNSSEAVTGAYIFKKEGKFPIYIFNLIGLHLTLYPPYAFIFNFSYNHVIRNIKNFNF